MSQKGSDYTIPETAAGAPRAGGSGLGLRHRRAVAHTHRPDLLYPRPPAEQYAPGLRSLRPAPPLLAVAPAALACGVGSRSPAFQTQVYRKLGDLTAAASGTSRPKFFVSRPGTGQSVSVAAPALPGRDGGPQWGGGRQEVKMSVRGAQL